MELIQDAECREWSAGGCGVRPVILPDGTGVAEVMVHRHRGFGLGDSPEALAEIGVFTYAYARKRRPSSSTVHEVILTGWPGALTVADRCACSVMTGELRSQVGEGEHLCLGRPDAFGPRRPPPDEAWEAKNAELLALGLARGHILHRADGKAEVSLSIPAPLLVSLIKDVPGRVYEPGRKAWVIPAVWAGDLAASLANAGVDVRETGSRPPAASASRAGRAAPAAPGNRG